MSLQTKNILGIEINTSSEKEILEEIRKYLGKSQKSKVKSQKNEIKPFVIFTPNPEIITYAQKDSKFKKIVSTAQINLPDGAGIEWAIKKLFGIEVPKIAGVDFMMRLVKMAEMKGLRIGLIGGRGDLADKTAECLLKTYPRLSIWAIDGPEINIEKWEMGSGKLDNEVGSGTSKFQNISHQYPTSHISRLTSTIDIEDYIRQIANRISKTNTQILFVALGFPKQEYFISQLSVISYQLSVGPIVLMAVGGAFDYLSGRIPRAPKWVRNIGLEWLFRLAREPWRLPRQIKGAEFFWKVLIS